MLQQYVSPASPFFHLLRPAWDSGLPPAHQLPPCLGGLQNANPRSVLTPRADTGLLNISLLAWSGCFQPQVSTLSSPLKSFYLTKVLHLENPRLLVAAAPGCLVSVDSISGVCAVVPLALFQACLAAAAKD